MKKIVTLLIIGVLIYFGYIYFVKETVIKDDRSTITKYEELEKKYNYYHCVNSPYKMDSLDDKLKDLKTELTGKSLGIYFVDLNNDYEFILNDELSYYSASAVKVFDAIYLIENAKEGKIDLNKTIKYTKRMNGSTKTDKHNIGDEISLKDLINYEISVSDNAAHFMLVDYIGASTLNKYFKDNHNINLNITNAKPFEYNYSAKMANESLKLLYNIILEDDEYSKIITEAMNNDYENSLNFDNHSFLHKYGLFAQYYHDIGINNTDNPYLISILTHYGQNNYSKLVSDIHKKIYNIYDENTKAKNAYCDSLK